MQNVAQKRDKRAFEELFDYYAPRIFGFMQKLGAEQAVAEELMQDVMTTMWRKAHLFDAKKSSLSTWIYRVARNRRIDLLRRNRGEALDPDDAKLIIDSTPLADDQMDGFQRDMELRETLNELPEEQQSLLKLAFFEGLSHTQIADHTGIPLGTVKSRIRLAFSKLRTKLEKRGISEAR